MNQKEGDNRRPLKSRRTVLAYKIAKYLSSKSKRLTITMF